MLSVRCAVEGPGVARRMARSVAYGHAAGLDGWEHPRWAGRHVRHDAVGLSRWVSVYAVRCTTGPHTVGAGLSWCGRWFACWVAGGVGRGGRPLFPGWGSAPPRVVDARPDQVWLILLSGGRRPRQPIACFRSNSHPVACKQHLAGHLQSHITAAHEDDPVLGNRIHGLGCDGRRRVNRHSEYPAAGRARRVKPGRAAALSRSAICCR